MKTNLRLIFMFLVFSIFILFGTNVVSAANGTTDIISVSSNNSQGNGASYSSTVSADGRYVAFESYASNLVSGDTNAYPDIFVRDLANNTTTRVSISSTGQQGNGHSRNPSISADGRYVTFDSFARNLVADDTNNAWDVFVHDMLTHVTTRVSISSTGEQGNDNSQNPSISADGRFIAFESDADNMDVGDTNHASDIFVRDLVSNTTARISFTSTGGQANGGSYDPAISADGRYIVFRSLANNLVTSDTNSFDDIFVRDLVNDSTIRVSVDLFGEPSNGYSYSPSISADGRYVAFESYADNLVSGDTNAAPDIFVRDLANNTTIRVSVGSSGEQGSADSKSPSISSDGRYVAFYSNANNLVLGDTNVALDVFVRDLANNSTIRVSVNPAGQQGNSHSRYLSISANGRFIAFESVASNLITNDINGIQDIFVHDKAWNVYPGESIQNALNQAYEGQWVVVHGHRFTPATYNENISINKMVILKSSWNDIVIINASNPNNPVITLTDASTGSIIQGFVITGSSNSGIYIDDSRSNIIQNNTILGDFGTGNTVWGICIVNGEYNIISNNTITDSVEGINLYNTKNNLITENTVTGSVYDGIALNLSTNNVIIDNDNVTDNIAGIRLINNSNNNFILYNDLTGNIWTSISLVDSQYNQINDNILSNNQEGMYLYASNNNIIYGNTANNNIWDGIAVHDSSNNTITYNLDITGNNCGLRIVGNSTGNQVYDNIINGNLWSNISLDTASSNSIHHNTLNDANVGIYMLGSSNNQIYNNFICDNAWDGIDILYSSNSNTIHNNDISGSYYGERILSSTNNTSYQNNYVNNTVQAYDDSTNNWDNGTTGNYWSDWPSTTPRSIAGGSSVDNYPSTIPF
ncbi:MAG: NosD domain-containing protein [Methanobacterium sp.]